MAGRDTVLERADTAVQRLLIGRSANGQMLLGLRGVGKTVLLNRMQAQAEGHGALTFKVEAPEGGSLPSLLIPELRRVLYSLDLSMAATQFVKSAGLALRNFASVFKVAVGEMYSVWIPRPVSPTPASSNRTCRSCSSPWAWRRGNATRRWSSSSTRSSTWTRRSSRR